MAFHIKPKEEKFYQFLSGQGELVHRATDVFYQAVQDPEKLTDLLEQIDGIEREADSITDKVIKKLGKTFITPFDREDIYTLTQKLDDFVDGIKRIIERLHLYNAGPLPSGALELAEQILKAAKQIEKSCAYLADLKKNQLKLEVRCKRMAAIEAEGDVVYRREMARLFRECRDPIEVIKWKEIYEHFEDLLDISEDIADLLKKVVLKYA
ncbi:DUF47 domain-containing protein [Acetonema longum]|uniref:Phosphate transport regulator n=1 Tax=Acetonema longum DSM 6540 TaxID=1009370 RepID=F7NP88_9FIRM|nr:DUF47 family protein [Acetonema longum]EGO62211.1 hypothetical protein ALO_19657 [Acetonema longum DSM 6540]